MRSMKSHSLRGIKCVVAFPVCGSDMKHVYVNAFCNNERYSKYHWFQLINIISLNLLNGVLLSTSSGIAIADANPKTPCTMSAQVANFVRKLRILVKSAAGNLITGGSTTDDKNQP